MGIVQPLPLYTYVAPSAYDDHVQEDCPYLDACRTRAAAEDWRAFSCIACEVDPCQGIETFVVSSESIGSRQLDSRLDAYSCQDSIITWRTESSRSQGAIGQLLSKAEQKARFDKAVPIVVGPADDDGQHTLFGGVARFQLLRGSGAETAPAIIVGKAACPRCMQDKQLVLSIVDDPPGEVIRDGFCRKCQHIIAPVAGGLEFFSDVRSRISETGKRRARAQRLALVWLRGWGMGVAA
jgi:hypothetical protein